MYFLFSTILFSGYNGPSANNVGQGAIGNNMNVRKQLFDVKIIVFEFKGAQPFAGPEPSMEVPGFGKNSNIHELFGKMIWRKMEQINDAALVDQLQNRIMNLIHDALASQNDKQQQQQQQQHQRMFYFGKQTNLKNLYFQKDSINKEECRSEDQETKMDHSETTLDSNVFKRIKF